MGGDKVDIGRRRGVSIQYFADTVGLIDSGASFLETDAIPTVQQYG